VTLALMLVARPAFADDDDMPPPDDEPAPPPAPPEPPTPAPPTPTPTPEPPKTPFEPPRTPPPAQQIPSTPDEPPVPDDAKTQFDRLARPPAQPVPVPTPSPVVLGGKPLPPGRFARPLEWKRSRFSKLDFGIMVAGGGLTLAAAIVRPRSKHVVGPILFDKPIENALRAPTTQQAYVYRDASDTGLSLLATWPFFVDAFITAWWYRGSRDTAEQMALIGLETLAVSGAIQGVTNVLVSRERPYGDKCREQADDLPNNAIDCTGSTHYRSFFSGHSAFSFTSASLICFEHMELKLLGGPWDAISCAGGYAVAAATATFRVTGVEHYPSDILTGALIGTAVGWGVPLLHSRNPNVGTVKTTGGLTMRIVPNGTGAGVVGVF
jgi:membrane-associated phospholipid phosphatase